LASNVWLPEFSAKIAVLERQKAELERRLAEAEARAVAAGKRAAEAEAACDVFRQSAKGMEQMYLEEKARADLTKRPGARRR
jgi:hypothetical protein